MVAVSSSFTTPVSRASIVEEGLFRMAVDGKVILWIPSEAINLEVRLMVYAHMKEAGHRGVAATLQRL